MTLADWSGITRLNDVTTGQAALAMAQRLEVPLFPTRWVVQGANGHLTCSCPDGERCDRPGKHPLIRWKEGASRDPQDLRETWTEWPHANVALPTGSASGIVVLDLDVRTTDHEQWLNGYQQLEAWLDTNLGPGWDVPKLAAQEQRTGGGGQQLLFRDPGGIRTLTGWLPGVDVRGDNGYVLLPPSLHVSGQRYAWTTEREPPALPDLLASQLRVARGSAAGGGGNPTSAYDYAEAKRTGPPPGHRDDFFNAYAYELRKAGRPEAEAVEAVRRVWELTEQGDDPYRWGTAEEKVRRVYADPAVEPEPRDPVDDTTMEWVAEQARRAAESDRAGDPESGGQPPSEPPSGDDGNVTQLRSNDGEEPPAYTLGTELWTAAIAAVRWDQTVRFPHGSNPVIWDDIVWTPDETGRIIHLFKDVIRDVRRRAAEMDNPERQQQLVAWARQLETGNKIHSVINLARSEPNLAIRVNELNANPMLLVVQNGTIDLETGKRRDSRATDLCTQIASVEYDPKADCPQWKKHVAAVTGHADGTADPDLATFLQRWAGYTLTGLTQEQKFAFMYGSGNNGKSVFIETLMRIMGTYAITGSSQVLTATGQQHETIIADLAGPRLVFIDETPRGRINEARIKQLTGTSRIRARKIARDSFEFDARFKIWIAGNNKPRISETSEGLWRRLDLIPFDRTVPPERRVRDFAAVLARDEGPGILNWALEGLRSYLELGTLGAPERVLSATKEYREEEDTFGQFVRDAFQAATAERAWHPNKLIIGMYQEWRREVGLDPLKGGIRVINNDLRRHGFERDSQVRRVTWYMHGSQTERGYFGPPLQEEAPAQFAWSG